MQHKKTARRGRGALSNPEGRFEPTRVDPVDDGWQQDTDAMPAPLPTVVRPDLAGSLISRNTSPDVPFDYSVNPYRGCEHGCVYCYARRSHAFLNLSPGLDFETQLFFKQDAAAALERELRAPGYRCKSISIGMNTDAYQPIEREYRVTRSILELMLAFGHPVSVVTKSTLIERDLDLLSALAKRGLASVLLSITTLDDELKRSMEPRAAAPQARLRTARRLSAAGIPVGVLVAPVIPAITDVEIEAILRACAEHGVRRAGYILLRLPGEIETMFAEWLGCHYPDRAEHVMSLMRQAHGGRAYRAEFGHRMRGSGPYVEMLSQRFEVACRKYGLEQGRSHDLDTAQFRPPPAAGDQLTLL